MKRITACSNGWCIYKLKCVSICVLIQGWGIYVYFMTRRDPQKHIGCVVYPCRPRVQWWLEHQLQQKCLTGNWPQGDTRCEHESSARLQEKMRLFKQCTWAYIILKPFLKTQKPGSVFVCTFAGRVQQGGLKRDHLNVVQVFINGHLNSKTGIWVHIGKGQQVCGTHKEVSMERVDGKTCRGKEWKNWSTFKMQQLLPPKFEVESSTSNDVLDQSTAVGLSHLCCSVFSWQPQSQSSWLDIFSGPSGSTPPERGYAGGGRRGSGRCFLQSIWIYSLQETTQVGGNNQKVIGSVVLS